MKATVVRLDVTSRNAGGAAVKGMSCGKGRETIQRSVCLQENRHAVGDEVMFVFHVGGVVVKVIAGLAIQKKGLTERPGVKAWRLLSQAIAFRISRL